MTRTVAVVPAAGSGERLGAGIAKAFVDLGGRTMLEHAVDGLHQGGYIAFILDENGKRQYNAETGKMRAEHKEWPTPMIGREITRTFLSEGGVLA